MPLELSALPDDVYGLITAHLGALSVVRLSETGREARRGAATMALLGELTLAAGMLEAAAQLGHLRALDALVRDGRLLTADVAAAAARGGQLEALQWLRAAACPCDAWVCAAAAGAGQLAALQWLRAPPSPCPCDFSGSAQGRARLVCSERGDAGGASDPLHVEAARGGHVATLQWIRDNVPVAPGKAPFNSSLCVCAALGGHVEMLRWLRADGCPWDTETARGAARGGHLGVLQWLDAQGCPMGDLDHLGCIAHSNRNRAMVKWLRDTDRGHPWDPVVCAYAAWWGYAAAVQWLHASQREPHSGVVTVAVGLCLWLGLWLWLWLWLWMCTWLRLRLWAWRPAVSARRRPQRP